MGDAARSISAAFRLRTRPRLDQIFGRRAEPIQAIRWPELIQVRRAFAEPIAAPDTLGCYIGQLVEALCPLLGAQGLGARRVDLLFHRVDDLVQAIRAGTAKLVREVKRLTRLLTDRLEGVGPGFGVEVMTLAAILAEPLAWAMKLAPYRAMDGRSGRRPVLARVFQHRDRRNLSQPETVQNLGENKASRCTRSRTSRFSALRPIARVG
jgi:nucleotidyltransferase/DNA polymerase involved in DNA repair